MANMMKMIKQAQAMQTKMQKMQEDLAEREVDFSSGGGMVTCRATCDGAVKSIKIDPKVVDPSDVEMLEDLVLTAVQGAVNLGRETMSEEMGKITKGLNIPGMTL
jgi:DNA-binding YbaB/EbfC family protein